MLDTSQLLYFQTSLDQPIDEAMRRAIAEHAVASARIVTICGADPWRIRKVVGMLRSAGYRIEFDAFSDIYLPQYKVRAREAIGCVASVTGVVLRATIGGAALVACAGCNSQLDSSSYAGAVRMFDDPLVDVAVCGPYLVVSGAAKAAMLMAGVSAERLAGVCDWRGSVTRFFRAEFSEVEDVLDSQCSYVATGICAACGRESLAFTGIPILRPGAVDMQLPVVAVNSRVARSRTPHKYFVSGPAIGRLRRLTGWSFAPILAWNDHLAVRVRDAITSFRDAIASQ